MLTFSEIVEKTKVGRRSIELSMERTKSYHPLDASLTEGLTRSDSIEVIDTLQQMSLAEVLAKSSTTGIQGAAYLVAPKLHDTIISASQETDLVPLISAYVVSEYSGNDILNVPVTIHRSFRPHRFSGGGALPVSTINVVKPQLTPLSFGLVVPIANDFIEDNQYGLIEYHARQSAKSFGEYASELALTTLKTATDGDGTVNGGASGNADETKWTGASTTGIDTLYAALSDDRWIPNTLILTTEAWEHSVSSTMKITASGTAVGTAADTYWKPDHVLNPVPISVSPPAPGFHVKLGLPPLDTLFCNSPALHAWATDTDTGGMTDCVTIMCDRANALLTARKRWLAVENYADPVADLTKAVISARQGSVTLYDDAIGVITET